MFTQHDIKRFIDAANLPEYGNKNLLYPLLTKEERQNIIRTSNELEERKIAAAIELQKIWRGYRTRTLLYSILQPTSQSGSYLSSNYSSSPTFSELRASLNSSHLSTRIKSSLSKDVSRIELSYQNYTEDALKKKKAEEEKLLTFQGFCAYTIQEWWRKILKEELQQRKLVVDIHKDQKRNLSSSGAVCIIQRAWRKHIDLQVFKYYKQLINFRSKGDPQFMLRCINPKEADILDAAAGVHVRFRLGGEKFPPNVYYKVFTHINVADVGAFAPRNYTKAATKLSPGKFIHSKGFDGNVPENDTDDWYERYENNGWRLVNDRVVKYLNQDPVVYETSQKKIAFSHEKLVRKQDLSLQKKRKKIEWMRKMYNAGMLKTKACEEEEEEVKELVQTAAEGIFMAAEESGPQNIEDWEVNELLQWTDGLNFDSYLQDWQKCGTTSIQTDLKGYIKRSDPLLAMLEENSSYR